MNSFLYTKMLRSNDDRMWRVDGKKHREDGPAIERANGDHEWWVDGQLNRVDGPAVEDADGDYE